MIRAAKGRHRQDGSRADESPILPSPFPARGLLRTDQVLKFIPVSRTTWWAGVRDGRFPPAIMIGRIPCWRARDINQLVEHGERDVRKKPARRTGAS